MKVLIKPPLHTKYRYIIYLVCLILTKENCIKRKASQANQASEKTPQPAIVLHFEILYVFIQAFEFIIIVSLPLKSIKSLNNL